MSSNKKLYKEELFKELNYEDDMEIVGGNVFVAITEIVNNVCASIKEKLFL